MPLSKDQKKTLKAQAHHLNPVVTIGQKGLTPAVIDELEITIEHHELIKVRIPAMEKTDKSALATSVCDAINADLVALLGRVIILYRQATKRT